VAVSPLTTVVVIAHNYARYLEQAVMSVVTQTRRPQLLVIDDASTDGTPEVMARLCARDPAIVCRRLAANIGLSRVRNLAAAEVATERVVFLDADDWLDPRYIERAEAKLAAQPAIDVLTTDMTIVRGDRTRVFRARVPEFWNDLLARNTIVQTSVIRRSLIAAIGGYDPTLDFEDWDFWIRVLQSGGRMARLPGAHVFRREHDRNKSKVCDEAAATAAVRAKHGRSFE
jgi:glycosyltransferase involved in cell wall biosynthesis